MFSSSPQPRGSDLLKVSSDVAQQHELSWAFREKWLWETSPGASAQGFRASLKLTPWPGLFGKSVHSSPFSLQPEAALLSSFRHCGNFGRGPCLQPLTQTCCVLTLSNIPPGALKSRKPQMAAVLMVTPHTEQIFPLSFNVLAPVTTGWWLEVGQPAQRT